MRIWSPFSTAASCSSSCWNSLSLASSFASPCLILSGVGSCSVHIYSIVNKKRSSNFLTFQKCGKQHRKQVLKDLDNQVGVLSEFGQCIQKCQPIRPFWWGKEWSGWTASLLLLELMNAQIPMWEMDFHLDHEQLHHKNHSNFVKCIFFFIKK